MLRRADASKSLLGGPVKRHAAIRRIAAFMTAFFCGAVRMDVVPDTCTCLLGPVAALHKRLRKVEISTPLSSRHF
jgi:hypothetical protein